MHHNLKRSAIGFLALLVITIFVASCGDKSVNDTSIYSSIAVKPLAANDTIVIAQSTGVKGVRFDSVYEVDLSNVRAELNGKVDDIYVKYMTPTSNDVAHWIWNFKRNSWDQFASATNYSTAYFRLPQFHSILSAGLNVRDYFSDSSTIRIKPYYSLLPDSTPDEDLQVTLLVYHQGYKPIYLESHPYTFVNDLAYNGKSYWMQAANNRFMELSRRGVVLNINYKFNKIMDGLTHIPNGFASLSNYSPVELSILDDDLTLQCKYVSPRGSSLSDLAWFGDKLLAINPSSGAYTILTLIDIDSLCQAGRYVPADTIVLNGRMAKITIGGEYILGLSRDMPPWLFRFHPTGDVLDSFLLPLSGVRDIEYANNILHVLCSGPRNFYSSGSKIVKIRMPR